VENLVSWVEWIAIGWFSLGLIALVLSSVMPWDLSGMDRLKIFLLGPLMLWGILRG
jgi:hypothetical protein